jgi:hypothetical protein
MRCTDLKEVEVDGGFDALLAGWGRAGISAEPRDLKRHFLKFAEGQGWGEL